MKTQLDIRTMLAAKLTEPTEPKCKVITLEPRGDTPVHVDFNGPYVTISIPDRRNTASSFTQKEALDLASAIAYAAQFVS